MNPNNSMLNIELATVSECEQVINLLKEVARWLKENGIHQWGFLLAGGEDEEIRQAILDKDTYIVRDNGIMVATFSLYEKQSEWDQHIWGEDSVDSIYLHRLAVLPLYMKKGIGSSILTWIYKNKVAETKILKLDCIAANTKLNEFYRKNHFDFLGQTSDGHCKYQRKSS
ncbi:GNAT family N-acetyltransferase [Bacillus sp. 31A1R]|uniref:GNAT family N-acetyltransferase n=1 Tax=Robertmurraya mangrovi TaxID=3098077 RepID=A0ABU5IWM4_9BACI|nr:GNAT family N-acetyltransferase [Bacillus sp. 31A1R]MDZ5471536.1 GNAT family N-acetyltransferase [Bacillus sp. 31A1R]